MLLVSLRYTARTTVSILSLHDALPIAPVLAGIESGALAYTENDPAAAVTGALTVSDADSPNLGWATVTISAHYQSGAVGRALPLQAGTTGSFDTGSGALTLSGSASVAA